MQGGGTVGEFGRGVCKRFIAYLKLMIGLRQKMAKALAYPAFLVLDGHWRRLASC